MWTVDGCACIDLTYAQIIQLVHKTIEKFGKSEVRPDEWIDYVIAGLEDPQNSVREAALKAIEGIYKYVKMTVWIEGHVLICI